jgi:hypothetical protein
MVDEAPEPMRPDELGLDGTMARSYWAELRGPLKIQARRAECLFPALRPSLHSPPLSIRGVAPAGPPRWLPPPPPLTPHSDVIPLLSNSDRPGASNPGWRIHNPPQIDNPSPLTLPGTGNSAQVVGRTLVRAGPLGLSSPDQISPMRFPGGRLGGRPGPVHRR